jgi:hypothetical protein
MGAREYAHWLALYRVEPWGEDRGDFRMASQMSLQAESNRNRKKRIKPFSPMDFLPDWWGSHAPPSAKQDEDVARAGVALMAKFAALTAGMESHDDTVRDAGS